DQQSDYPPGREGGLGQAGRGAAGDESRRVREISARRYRKMGARGSGLRHQGGLGRGLINAHERLVELNNSRSRAPLGADKDVSRAKSISLLIVSCLES